jgi:hypothetical protein
MRIPRVAIAAGTLAACQLFAGSAAAQNATDLTCTQCVGSSDIANNAVGSGKIADGSIKSNDMAANAVKTANLNNGSVTFNKLATGVRGAVDGAIENLSLLYVYVTDVGMVGAECPVDTVAVSANCACNSNGGENNSGTLGLCASFGVGSIAGCLSDGATFDPQLPEPIAEVEAVCLGGTTTDGSAWVPVPPEPTQAAAEGSATQWRQRQYEVYEAAFERARKESAIRQSRMRR